jgi:hypothetical protein
MTTREGRLRALPGAARAGSVTARARLAEGTAPDAAPEAVGISLMTGGPKGIKRRGSTGGRDQPGAARRCPTAGVVPCCISGEGAGRRRPCR